MTGPTGRVAIFGGSFDPPHVAHLAVAAAATEAGQVDRLLWVPAATSPFKVGAPAATPAQRLEMVRLAVKDDLEMTTPANFTTNNDIVGGNSGSPMLNADGQIVGLAFDGNIHSISGSYWFNDKMNRSIGVHPAYIRTALEKVYNARELLAEIDRR